MSEPVRFVEFPSPDGPVMVAVEKIEFFHPFQEGKTWVSVGSSSVVVDEPYAKFIEMLRDYAEKLEEL